MAVIYQPFGSKNVFGLGARESLIYPFNISSGKWTEIRISVDCYVTTNLDLLSIPTIEQIKNTQITGTNFTGDYAKGIFFFGLKETGRNLYDTLPFFTGNNFIGYATRSNGSLSPLTSCVPSVNNDPGFCSAGNIASPNCDAYRMISADTGYFTTLLNDSCVATGPTNRNWGFDSVCSYDDNVYKTVQKNAITYTRNGANNADGFVAMASGTPTYVCRNCLSVRVNNRDQTGQSVVLSLFNDAGYNTQDVTGLRIFTSAPFYAAQNEILYTSGFSATGGPLTIPNSVYLYWPFFNNHLVISNIVVEKYQ